ncbi:MAG: Asp23/Gls24 family envelope stress response protein [Firmicutes bacterium]|nr:Asp23/Gls24 family envelope stress response protein [Bacillota bacterium]
MDGAPAAEERGGQTEGNVRISDDVVAVIAGMSCTEVEGVAGMSGGLVGDLSEILGKKNFSKGVKVEVGEKEAAIDLFVVVDYGVRIPEVAQRVQENVKTAVEIMTGLKVVEVNVHVHGVAFNPGEQEEARVK